PRPMTGPQKAGSNHNQANLPIPFVNTAYAAWTKSGRAGCLSGLIARDELHDKKQHRASAPEDRPSGEDSAERYRVFWFLDEPNENIRAPEGQEPHQRQFRCRCLWRGFVYWHGSHR
ncbi:hypothetical protein, partial [Croceicoccus hydrothermalis]|uniref:hypothetical protein n=1 Tax=Croceicoccus hydrothermalis TaxID=2867964 RepID=UPI001EFAE770